MGIVVVPPLPVPDDTDRVNGREAVDLFADRAAAVLPGFAVDERNRHLVVRICRRLDGIPLSIELAAAWVRTLSLPDIEARLDDSVRLLTRSSRTAPSRQRTLAGAIDWSHDLCPPEERALSGATTNEVPPYAAVDEQIAARATGEIGAEAFRTAFEEGKALGLEDVIAYALEEKAAKPATESRDTGPGLTRRQLEIAHLVAEGMSNKEIAARLVIALRTAETHVENVLTKLGFTSRTQIATWMVEHRADR
ncbi:response regulator transcription factor [Saccharothrix deserti]|uniref:response regulator transcription factor n=1 Tax=Saccharothrix deserti TaxID=2593674 RepID=UPI001EE49BBB|nr:helix-turn-helix transcriptional regulator [Saccharothrix deserti]